MIKFRQYINEIKMQVWNVPVKYDSPSGSGTKVHKVKAFHAHNAKNVAAVNHKQDHPDHKNVTFGEPQLHEGNYDPHYYHDDEPNRNLKITANTIKHLKRKIKSMDYNHPDRPQYERILDKNKVLHKYYHKTRVDEDDFSPVLGPGDPQGNEPATNRAKKQDLGMDEEETPFALRLKKIKDAIPNSRPQDAPASLGTPSDRSPVQVPKIVKGS